MPGGHFASVTQITLITDDHVFFNRTTRRARSNSVQSFELGNTVPVIIGIDCLIIGLGISGRVHLQASVRLLLRIWKQQITVGAIHRIGHWFGARNNVATTAGATAATATGHEEQNARSHRINFQLAPMI